MRGAGEAQSTDRAGMERTALRLQWGERQGCEVTSQEAGFQNSGAPWLPGTGVFLSVSRNVRVLSVRRACPPAAALGEHTPPQELKNIDGDINKAC